MAANWNVAAVVFVPVIANDSFTSKPVKLILVVTRDEAVGFALPDAQVIKDAG